MYLGFAALFLIFIQLIIIVIRMTQLARDGTEVEDIENTNCQNRADAYISDKKDITGFYSLAVVGILAFIFFFIIPLSQAIHMRIIGQPIYGTVERDTRPFRARRWEIFESRMNVSYTIDNVQFTATLNERQWNTIINSQIRLFVHPNNPSRVTTARLPHAYYLYIGFSLLFIIPSLSGIQYKKKRIAIYEDMMRLGYAEDEIQLNETHDDDTPEGNKP